VKVEDVKQKRSFSITLIEEVLTKKPFTKNFALLLLDEVKGSSLRADAWFDLAKLSRECLKSLTAEELRQLFIGNADKMSEYEAKYTNINGSSAVNELAKIVLRYTKEGKPRPISPSAPAVEIQVEQ